MPQMQPKKVKKKKKKRKKIFPKEGLIINVYIKQTDTFNIKNTQCNVTEKFTR